MKQHARFGVRLCLLTVGFICVTAMLVPAHRIVSEVRHALEAAPVFANGSEGYHCYRIPAIVQTPEGTLLAFAEARKNDCSDFGDIRIVMRSSHDDGESWSALQTIASNGNLQAGNPVPVVDTMDTQYPQGRIFLFFTTADAPEDAVQQGHGSVQVWYRASTDDGATWASPVEITASVKLPSWRDYAGGSGHGLQLTDGPHKGRIFIPAYHSEGPPRAAAHDVEAHSFFSDDHGKIWSLGATVAWPSSNESSAAQAGDGSVVMNSRDESGKLHARVVSVSSSGGEHWDKTFAAHDLPDPACEGSMVSYVGPDHKLMLLLSSLLNTNTGHRQGLTVSESADGGRTWPSHAVIDKGSSAYSDLVVMRGGKLGILWERWEDGVLFRVRPIESLF